MKYKRFKPFSPYARRITIGTIIACLITVLGAMFAFWYFTPAKVADREINRLAHEYYENYFYDSYFGNLEGDERRTEFEKYIISGLPTVYLRQLLNYDNGKHQDSLKYFTNPSYSCDTNATKVTYYPYSPFGKTDYKLKIEMHCEKI